MSTTEMERAELPPGSVEDSLFPPKKSTIMPPKLAQRLAKKKLTEETAHENPLSVPFDMEILQGVETQGKVISSGPKIRVLDKEISEPPPPPPSQQLPVEHPREWVSNMQGNKKHSSRRFSPGRDPTMERSESVMTLPHRAASAPIPSSVTSSTVSTSRSLKVKEHKVDLHSSLKPRTPYATVPQRNRSSPERTGRPRGHSQQRSPQSLPSAGTARPPQNEGESRRFVSPHPKLPSQRQERRPANPPSRRQPREELPKDEPAILAGSIWGTDNHRARRQGPSSSKLSNQWTPIDKRSHMRPREDRERRTRSTSPQKATLARSLEKPQNRSASADFRSNPWGDRIRAQLSQVSQVPQDPPGLTPAVQLDNVRSQIDDYLAETVKRSLSPERLGRTNIKHLDLKSMESLLKGLPPSINSLLNIPQLAQPPSDPLRDSSSRRRSSPGANHRRDVLTDAAEWSRLLDWLDSIGMSRHSNCFRQGGATKLSIVELLGPHDLIQMGIHRPDAVKMIQSIQEISRRTKFLTEEAMSAPPIQPKRRLSETRTASVSAAVLSGYSSTAAQPSVAATAPRRVNLDPRRPVPSFSSGTPLLNFKPPSSLQPPSGLVSVPLLLESFDRAHLSPLLELWCCVTSQIRSISHLLRSGPSQILQHMTTVDFYLRLHIAITPHRSGHSPCQSSEVADRMEEFKRYLEGCFQSEEPEVLALVSSRLYAAYAGVVMVPQPLHNPAYAALFDLKWIRALRVRLMKFLEGIRALRVPSIAPPLDPVAPLGAAASAEPLSSELSPITSTDLSDHPLSTAAAELRAQEERDSDSCPSVSQLPTPPPEPPYPPRRATATAARAATKPPSPPHPPPASRHRNQPQPPQPKKKTKPVKTKKMTAMLGSGPLLIEEVQEEVTDDDEEQEQEQDQLSLSPLQSIKQLGAQSSSSFVPIPFSLRPRQPSPLEQFDQPQQSPDKAPSSSGTPVADLDVEAEAEDYDFSQIHHPDPDSNPASDQTQEETQEQQQTVVRESAIDEQQQEEEHPEEAEVAEEQDVQYSGYYDEEGNWRYNDSSLGYYDPQGLWHGSDSTADAAVAIDAAEGTEVGEGERAGAAVEEQQQEEEEQGEVPCGPMIPTQEAVSAEVGQEKEEGAVADQSWEQWQQQQEEQDEQWQQQQEQDEQWQQQQEQDEEDVEEKASGDLELSDSPLPEDLFATAAASIEPESAIPSPSSSLLPAALL